MHIINMKNRLSAFLYALVAVCMLMPAAARAFAPESYAPSSRLAQGRWVKVAVERSGLYCITHQQLRQWGFDNPQAVRVYGYGGKRIANELIQSNYIDDLPLVQSEQTDRGIVFYGVGPEDWTRQTGGAYASNSNIYTTHGYYFLSDTGEEQRSIESQGLDRAMQPVGQTRYDVRLQHETDRTSPGEAGYLLVGESFKAQNPLRINFDTPGADTVAMSVGLVTENVTASRVYYTVNGKALDSHASDGIPVSPQSYQHGGYTTSWRDSLAVNSDAMSLTIEVNGAWGMTNAWLDYVAVTYKRPISLGTASLCFDSDSVTVKMTPGQPADMRVWDVTNPLQITALKYGKTADGGVVWTNDYHGTRSYAAWAPATVATMPSPAFAGSVANQNLHALPAADMVIFTLPEYISQANRIAEMHRTDDRPLAVNVVNVEEAYNEFASGAADVSALRLLLKMLYDRAAASDSLAAPRYALLMGRATYDNRHLTSQFDKNAYGTIPGWMTGSRSAQLSDNGGYVTDDFIAMLADGSGANVGLDNLDVAVGRMPLRSVSEARSAVDKLEQYVRKNKAGTWRNSYLFLADDGNSGVHADETEKMIANMLATPQQQAFLTKVYVDAYDIIAGSCEGGRELFHRSLNEGVLWWSYCGHANNHMMTGENLLTYTDINNMYLTRVPILMAATCDFLRWDSNTLSGGEILFHERNGGTIATISATRPVYITDNAYFTRAMGRAMAKRDNDGCMPRLGDIYRNTKNDIRDSSGSHISNLNRLRFVLMGDPAMRLAHPDNIVRLDSIDGQPVTEDEQVTLKALQRAVVKGSVVDPQGNLMSSFDGTVEVDIYDAEQSMNTKGGREDNVVMIFEQHGDKLFSGSARVEGGRFALNVAMPGEVADNFRPATMNMFARSDASGAEAVGVNRDFYVYGFDETVPADNVAPVIESMALNHESFETGGNVDTSPMLIARVRDDVGINLSTAGVGHRMTITLDGSRTYTDVSHYFSPSTDGTPSGTIYYPFEDLVPGPHSLTLKVWDTAGNSAASTIDFNAVAGLQPKIYDVKCNPNPASEQASFYITHDRPDRQLTVTIEVFSLMGAPVWQSTVTGRSDMMMSAPVVWDLLDNGGRRVPRGIYLYRATVSEANGDTYSTASRKMAVTAR